MIESDYPEILTDICWAFSYITDGEPSRIRFILNTNVLPRIIKLLEHQYIAIQVACLRTIGNLLTGSDEETQFAIDLGVIDTLNKLITHPKKAVRKEVCWSISNITAGNSLQIQACLDCKLIDKTIHSMQYDEPEIRKEAVWAVSNCTACATPEQYKELVNRGILKAYASVLNIPDTRVLFVTIAGIDNILKCGKNHFIDERGENPFCELIEEQGLLDKLEELQMHQNH